MDQNIRPAAQPDYHAYDQVWQRVAPDLEPYPGYRDRPMLPTSVLPASPVQQVPPQQPPVQQPPMQQPPVQQPPVQQPPVQQPPVQQPPVQQPPVQQPPVPAQPPAVQLPGGIKNPCCMGSQALDMLEVLTGFIEEELIDRRYFMALSRQAPSWAKQGLRDLAENAGSHAKELMSAVYMITGKCYRPQGVSGEIYIGSWCPALRERYHTEACGGLNYARAAEGTTDPCLREILDRLSRDEYHHARVLLEMLQRSMGC